MLEIKTWRDPYDAGFSPTIPTSVRFDEGLTVVIGCNGSGKTTLLKNIEDECNKNHIPVYRYDNLYKGGTHALSSAFAIGNYSLIGGLMSASEGEMNAINFNNVMSKIDHFLKEGYMKEEKYLHQQSVDDQDISNKRCILFDAIDSGLSLDFDYDLKHALQKFIEGTKNLPIELYVIITTNSYELARHEKCFDVNRGKYVKIDNYEDYRECIIRSRNHKEQRIIHQKEWFAKKREREIADAKKSIESYQKKIQSIKDNAEKRNMSISIFDQNKIYDYEREISKLQDKIE